MTPQAIVVYLILMTLSLFVTVGLAFTALYMGFVAWATMHFTMGGLVRTITSPLGIMIVLPVIPATGYSLLHMYTTHNQPWQRYSVIFLFVANALLITLVSLVLLWVTIMMR